jgi:hypothetical protein
MWRRSIVRSAYLGCCAVWPLSSAKRDSINEMRCNSWVLEMVRYKAKNGTKLDSYILSVRCHWSTRLVVSDGDGVRLIDAGVLITATVKTDRTLPGAFCFPSPTHGSSA